MSYQELNDDTNQVSHFMLKTYNGLSTPLYSL